MDYQLLRWEEFCKLEPFGGNFQEILHAVGYMRMTNSVLSVMFGLAGKNGEMYKVEDFMPSQLMKDKPKKVRSRQDEIDRFEMEKAVLSKCGKPVKE